MRRVHAVVIVIGKPCSRRGYVGPCAMVLTSYASWLRVRGKDGVCRLVRREVTRTLGAPMGHADSGKDRVALDFRVRRRRANVGL